MAPITYSLVIPVYRNEESLPELISALSSLSASLSNALEVVFVVDGSPDRSFAWLRTALPPASFASQLVAHSRNFGSFAAVRTGLAESRGTYVAVMAADLQESPELIKQFFHALETRPIDIAIGTRNRRDDPFFSSLGSTLFWSVYRSFIQSEMPKGGVDVFAVSRRVCDLLLTLRESNTTLIGLLFWVGFERAYFPYDRQARRHGKSAWSFGRKVRYLSDSVFAFSDLPIRVMTLFGLLGMSVSVVLSTVVLVAKFHNRIDVPGYAATVLMVMFFGGLNSLGLGLLGSYIWRTFENTKARPSAWIVSKESFTPKSL